MKIKIVTPPAVEPVSLNELKLQLNNDSGTISENSTLSNVIPSGSYPIDYELMTLDVAPATTWAVGDIITGQTSSKTCIVVTVITTKTYIVKSRSGAFTLGEIVGVTGTADKLADQGAANPTFSSTYLSGYMVIGSAIDVLGHNSVVYLNPVNNGTSGTVDAKIQEADVSTGPFTDWSTGAFTQVTEANDTVIQKKQYTGTKQYIRVIAKVLVAACEFGSTCMVWEPVSTEDSMLLGFIKTATKDVEKDTCRKLITQTLDYFPSRWPDSRDYEPDRIKIPYGNLAAVTSVKWKDTTGTETTLVENTDYLVELNGTECGYIVLPYQESWPNGELFPSNPITIRFICGYGLAADIPDEAKQAIKNKSVNYYMNRGDDFVGVNQVSYDKTYCSLISLVGKLYDMDFL